MPVTTSALDVRTRARSWRSLARSYRMVADDPGHLVAAEPTFGDEGDVAAAMRRQVVRHAGSPYGECVVPRLTLTTLDQPAGGLSTVLRPVACLILQGSKRVTIGDAVLDYGAGDYLLASLDVPALGSVLDAGPDRPYVAAGLMLDRALLADLVGSMPPDGSGAVTADPSTSFAIGRVTADQLDAWAGLLDLLDRPGDIAVLARARERELLYRLLQGALGSYLRQMAREDGRLERVRRAIHVIHRCFEEVLPTTTLADHAGMSVACFHRHFRAMTAMSPLQYQKAVRLQTARRLLAAGTGVSAAAFAVGYNSASQFSREYRRHFGLSPSSDAQRLRINHRPIRSR